MKIKAVIFDLDHTLFDRHETLRAVAREFRRSFDVNKALSDDRIAELWIYADDHFVYDGWKYIFAYLVENGVFEKAPDYADYRSFVYKNFAKTAVAFTDCAPMLNELKRRGYTLGLITNGSHALQYKKLDLIGLRDSFDEIIVSGDVAAEKPDREIFTMMSDKLSIAPREMVYVGDNPKNDIDGARCAGYHTVWMKSTGLWQYGIKRADEEVSTVGEVPDAVEKIARAIN